MIKVFIIFHIVERDHNNCKYINQLKFQLKSLKVELLRNSFSLKYNFYYIFKKLDMGNKFFKPITTEDNS